MPFLWVVVVFSLAVVFEILVVLILDPLGVEFDPPQADPSTLKNLNVAGGNCEFMINQRFQY